MGVGSVGGGNTWGTRSQLAATLADLKDLQGNKDGLWGNEKAPAGTPVDAWERNPLANKAARFLEAGLSTKDEVQALTQFRTAAEARWGAPVTNLPASQFHQPELFAAQKAIALTRLGRTPADVVDGFVAAKGSVDGQEIAPREVFIQRFKPRGEPSGVVVVVSPGFQETGRNFLEQVDALNRLGHDVVVMDQQWAGQTKGGKPGALDRGFGVARDVASVTAHANQLMQQEYAGKAGHRVVLLGNSMGAGPGVLGAMTMNDQGRIKLDGPAMPKGVSAVLQAPFLGASPGLLNGMLEAASHLPLLNKLAMPAAGLPVLTHDPVAAAKGAQGAVAEDVRAQLSAMGAANKDLVMLWGLLVNNLKVL